MPALHAQTAADRQSAAQTKAGERDELAIRAVLDAQVAAWNRGDIAGFMAGYDNSPHTTFVGKTVTHGWAEVLQHYRDHYTSRALMGTLTFTDLDVRQLTADVAVVTGNFRLKRSAGDHTRDSGVFSLVFRRGKDGWKIVLDHTS